MKKIKKEKLASSLTVKLPMGEQIFVHFDVPNAPTG